MMGRTQTRWMLVVAWVNVLPLETRMSLSLAVLAMSRVMPENDNDGKARRETAT